MKDMRDITCPTPTALGTVLIPMQSRDGTYIVVEFTRKMFRDMMGDVERCFRMIDSEAETAAAILKIERHESVV